MNASVELVIANFCFSFTIVYNKAELNFQKLSKRFNYIMYSSNALIIFCSLLICEESCRIRKLNIKIISLISYFRFQHVYEFNSISDVRFLVYSSIFTTIMKVLDSNYCCKLIQNANGKVDCKRQARLPSI